MQSKFNCSRDILLHLFMVCHFHGVLVNKQVCRNTRIMRTARGHLLENLKTKSFDVFLWIEPPACLLCAAAQVCWAIVPICRGQTRMEPRPACAAWLFVTPAPGTVFWEVLVGKQPGKAATIAAAVPSQLLVLHPSQGAGAA